MKVVVIYDSVFGNTEKVAQAIADALRPAGDVVISRVGDANPEQLQGAGLVIIGSPTRAFRPTGPIQKFLESIPKDALKGAKAAAFDTRADLNDIKGVLKFMVKTGGWAAPRIAQSLQRKGSEMAAAPEGFIVKGQEGPPADGEIERAAAWAKTLAAAPQSAKA